MSTAKERAFINLLNEIEHTLKEFEISVARLKQDNLPQELPFMFRSAHNIKGACFLFGLPDLGEVVHALEDLLENIMRRWVLDSEGYALVKTTGSFLNHYTQALRLDRNSPPATSEIKNQIADYLKRHSADFSSTPMVLWQEPDVSVPTIAEMARQRRGLHLVGAGQKSDGTTTPARATGLKSLSPLFTRLKHSGKELAQELSKTIDVEITGADVEIPGVIVDRLTGPLIHLLRNSIDHGVESDSDRKRLGKSLPAKLRIHGEITDQFFRVSVSDDGRGIDPHLVLKKAVERGLINPVTRMSEEKALELIFRPGFSTRDSVTQISGRGIGMDVVLDQVRQLGGQIQTHNDPGFGCEFVILIPL